MLIGRKKNMQIRNRWLVSILCLIIVCSFSVLLITFQENATEAKVKIVYIPKVLDKTNDFWCAVQAGAEMAVKDYDMEFVMMAPKDEKDIATQNEYIYQAIELKPDAIVVAPCSYTGSKEAIEAIRKSGIKVILIDSNVEGEIQDCIISTDNYQAGKKIAEYINEYITETSEILVVSHVKSSSTAMEREQGVRDGLGENEEQIKEVIYSDSDYAKAYLKTLEYLEEHPNVDVVIGLNEYSAVGAAKAIESIQENRRIYAIGFDNAVEEIQLLEKGTFGAIVIQKAFNMGYLGMETAYHASIGKEIPKKIDSGSKLITKENMYTEENQKLLFPFQD